MGKQAVDISQIRKYLNGELDARAMHRLERQAQDDPFLMDALEGYQNARSDQQMNLNSLAARLNERVSEKRSRIIPLRIIAIAASVMIICGAGLWWLKQKPGIIKPPSKMQAAVTPGTASSADTVREPAKPAKNTMAAAAAKKPAQNAGTAEMPSAPNAAKLQANADKEAAPAVIAADTKAQYQAVKDSTPLNEMIAMGYTGAKKKDTTARVMLKEVVIDTAPQHMLQAKVAGVKVYPSTESAADLNKVITQGNLGNIAINQLTTNPVVQGKTIGQDKDQQINRTPVKAGGTNQVARTDAKRYFKTNADTSPSNLAANAPGFRARRSSANLTARDTVKAKEDSDGKSEDLAETIATGYTSQPVDASEMDVAAHPQKGWSAFRRYLKINAVSPDQAAGTVKITFSVDKFGSVSNIKVIKGLSDAANKKAISLVKDGPEWAGNSNKRPETVTLRIKFGK
jgi:hypothetical protein